MSDNRTSALAHGDLGGFLRLGLGLLFSRQHCRVIKLLVPDIRQDVDDVEVHVVKERRLLGQLRAVDVRREAEDGDRLVALEDREVLGIAARDTTIDEDVNLNILCSFL